MKRLTEIAAALLICAQPLAAASCCDPCNDWCDMGGDFELGAHALYLSPMHCEFDYARIGNSPGAPLEVRTANCSADWGLRAFGRYISDCSFIGVSYQWFESGEPNRAEGTDIQMRDVGGSFGRIESNLNLRYQNVDFRFGRYLHRACGRHFYVFGNGRWINVEFSRRIRGIVDQSGALVSRSEKAALEGGAIGVGTGAEFDLLCDIALFGEANLLGVIADRKTEQVEFFDGTASSQMQNTTANYGTKTCINPEMVFRLGANYTYTCGCWSVVGEVGYEVDYFWNAFAFPNQLSPQGLTGDNGWARTCEDVGFSGLFFGLRVLF